MNKRTCAGVKSCKRAAMLLLFLIAANIGCEPHGVAKQRSTPDWIGDVVCLLVGPIRTNLIPDGTDPKKILDDFRPDLAEWSIIHREPFASQLKNHPFYPPKIQGGCEYEGAPVATDKSWLRWKEMFGFDWKPSEENGVGVDVNGKLLDYGVVYYKWRMCHNCPNWHRFQKESLLALARDPGVAVIRQDNIGGPVGVTKRGGFCKWCNSAFRRYLDRTYAPDDLNELEIADIQKFDIREYVKKKGYDRNGTEALDDPLVLEHLNFLYESNLAAWNDIVAGIRSIRPSVPVCGNQGPAAHCPYGAIVVSQRNDAIFLEHNLPWQYPHKRFSWRYKVEQAAGRHRKPVWVWDFGRIETLEKPDYSTCAELFVAECYANGAVPYFLMSNFIYGALGKSHVGTLAKANYDRLKKYAQFARANRDLLTRTHRSHADTAVIYSLPSAMYRYSTYLSFRHGLFGEQMGHIEGFVTVLDHMHIPYDVLIFGGNPNLWDDSQELQRLREYKLLILPNCDAMSEKQAEAIQDFVTGGGSVIFSGDLGLRDVGFRRRRRPLLPDIARIGNHTLGSGRVSGLSDQVLRLWTSQQKKGLWQTVHINQKQAKPVVVKGWSKAETVRGPGGGDYSLYLDVGYTDGTRKFGGAAPFEVGTHDWQEVSLTLEPDKAIKSIKVYALFRGSHWGTVWFDDFSVTGDGSDKNLVLNPGLESVKTGEIEHWKSYFEGYDVDMNCSHSGRSSARCSLPPLSLDPKTFGIVKDAVTWARRDLQPLIDTNADPNVYINPFLKANRLIIHVLNYDYIWGKDEMKEKRDISVSLKLPTQAGRASLDVHVRTPDSSEEMILKATRQGNRLAFVLPTLRLWAIAYLDTRGT